MTENQAAAPHPKTPSPGPRVMNLQCRRCEDYFQCEPGSVAEQEQVCPDCVTLKAFLGLAWGEHA